MYFVGDEGTMESDDTQRRYSVGLNRIMET